MKNIFEENADIHKTAIMNWRTRNHDHISNMITIANGFMTSALNNADIYISDNTSKDADIVIFPMLFNVNHAIELYLKSIIWSLNILLSNDRKVEGNHNIRQLLSVANARVAEFEKDSGRFGTYEDMTSNLNLYVTELFTKIELVKENGKKEIGMDFSRYPFSNKYVSHFYIEDFDNVPVDLENFRERFHEIGENLKSISYTYLDHVDQLNQMKSENR